MINWSIVLASEWFCKGMCVLVPLLCVAIILLYAKSVDEENKSAFTERDKHAK